MFKMVKKITKKIANINIINDPPNTKKLVNIILNNNNENNKIEDNKRISNKWSAQEIEILNNLKKEGKTNKEIGIILDRSARSIKDKYTKNNNTDNKIKKSNKKENYELTIDDIRVLLDIHIKYINDLNKFKKNKLGFKMRLPNFPEGISENIIKEYIKNIEQRNCISSQTGGDLEVINNKQNVKVEVKCFASKGPTSFGPTEKWNELYFLDATNFLINEYKIYKINLSNNSEIFYNIKVNKNKTYNDQCKDGKRPRLPFNSLKEQLKDNVQLVYKGSIENL